MPAAGHEPLDRLGAIRRTSRNCIRVVGTGIEPAAGHEQAALGRRVEWLPGLDSNQNWMSQSHLCCHYTTGQWMRESE
jgi:hypothetical protein